jgi:hypothetical protein
MLALPFLICMVLGVDIQSEFIQFFCGLQTPDIIKICLAAQTKYTSQLCIHFVEKMYKMQCYIPVLEFFIFCKL